VLIYNALWRMSVGGVVPRILLFILLGSVFLIVTSIVSSIFFPRWSPRCLQVSGVSIPIWFSPCMTLGEVLMDRAVVFLMFMLSPLTVVYWLHRLMIGCRSSALSIESGFRLSSAKRIGPIVVLSSVEYIKFL
jgi:hypothetical protein